MYHQMLARIQRNREYRPWIPRAIMLAIIFLVILCIALVVIEVALTMRGK